MWRGPPSWSGPPPWPAVPPVFRDLALVPSDPNVAIQRVRDLKKHGENYFKSRNFGLAMENYLQAMTICTAHEFTQNAAEIHIKLAEISVTFSNFDEAEHHARMSIKLNPHDEKGYYCQADICTKAAVSLTQTNIGLARRKFQLAVEAHCDHFTLTRDLKSLCDAVVLGLNQECTPVRHLEESNLSAAELRGLIVRLLEHPESTAAHFKFLLLKTDTKSSETGGTLSCTLGGLSLSPFLVKSCFDESLLQELLSNDIKPNFDDIQNAVKTFANGEESLEMIKMILSCLPPMQPTSLNLLCDKSIEARKECFTSYFISCGAIPSINLVVKGMNWKEPNEHIVTSAFRGASTLDRTSAFMDILSHSTELASKVLECGEPDYNLIDLGPLMESLATAPELLEQLLLGGVPPNGIQDTPVRPLDAVLYDLKRHSPVRRAMLAQTLMKHNADSNLVHPRDGTTVIHKATELALATGKVEMLRCLCNHYEFPQDGRLTNKLNKTPFHLALQGKRNETSEKVCLVLSECNIDPNVVDGEGRKAGSHIKTSKDRRLRILQEAAQKFKGRQQRPALKTKGKRKKHGKSRKAHSSSIPVEPDVKLLESSELDGSEPPGLDYSTTQSASIMEDLTLVHVKAHLKSVLAKSDSYFTLELKRQLKSTVSGPTIVPRHDGQQEKTTKDVLAPPDTKIQPETSETEKELHQSPVEPLCGSTFPEFEDLPWEVECPEKVVKFFKDKRIPRQLQEQTVRKIQMLANGEWRKKLSKPVSTKVQHLYEARITKSARLLWEVVIQFSPRCSAKSDQESPGSVRHVYSEVIRVWDIVLDHDNIDICIRNIERSHELGYKACDVARDKLVPLAIHGPTNERLPQRYLLTSEFEAASLKNEGREVIRYAPAASTKEGEFNVITFYSFSSAAVKSMLEGENARRDFPFKEWREEHDIITMPDDSESILLLGRSGTGKTTCCLYRMWNRFQTYWSCARNSGPLLPKMVYGSSQENERAYDSEAAAVPPDPSDAVGPCERDEGLTVDLVTTDCIPDQVGAQDQNSLPELSRAVISNNLEHLHQVFVTKNHVLCTQMKKRFFDMASSSKLAENHMAFEDEALPCSIAMISDLNYPLFVTSRQFLVLLDHSLGDGKNFFSRKSDGTLAVKIISSDYDLENPDTIVDIFESDTDEHDAGEEGDYESHVQPSEGKVSKRTEVTASYFANVIWPKISYNCIDKRTDPMLVWMEIKSFIKGSRQAMETQSGYMTEKEYEDLGRKLAPNFVAKRSEVYMIFKRYHQYMQNHVDLFDECDCVHNIYTRMNDISDLPWSFHHFYVDEVQDFTQAELSLILRCCRNPNGLFLTGDTAQSIMRGIAFRFEDLKSLFHAVQETTIHLKKSAPVVVPRVHSLTINFRSHSGILRLASSVIDLLKEFFPSSFDTLPGDEGMFPGPKPALLYSCTVSDLAVLLRNRKRDASQIEFGAHQAIIVQSEDAKKALPDVLQAGVVLTVFEAKGLEFDDVLLYNFFAHSVISAEWRVVSSFLDTHPDLIHPDSQMFNSSKPRPLPFDEQQHKSLAAELKYLYTAITRAKCNLWIYDAHSNNRLPMFDYWRKRGLADVIKDTESSDYMPFAVTSTPEEWKEQGDYFKRKHLWEPAMKCYKKAQQPHLEFEAKAYSLFQQARACRGKEMQNLYLQAALSFLQCDQHQHNAKHLLYAAKSLKNAGEHGDAAKLYHRLGQHQMAFKGFWKAKDLDGCAAIRERFGDYSGAVKVYLDHRRPLDAIKRAQQYDNNGITLRDEVKVHSLAHSLAVEYSRLKNEHTLLKVLEYVPVVAERIQILKNAGYFQQACKLLCEQGDYDEACRIYSAQGLYKDAIQLAERTKNYRMKAKCVLQLAVASVRCRDANIREVFDAMNTHRELERLSKHAELHLQGKACLLLGLLDRDVSLCEKALSVYKSIPIKIGSVEAFNAMLKLTQEKSETHPPHDLALHACKCAHSIIKSIEYPDSSSAIRNLADMEEFYNLEKNNAEYRFPIGQNVWVSDFDSCSANKPDFDEYGMLQLDVSRTHQVVKHHLESLTKKWLNDLQIQEEIFSHLSHHAFHHSLLNGKGYLQQCYRAIPCEDISRYLKQCLYALEFGSTIMNEDVRKIFVGLFSPQAMVFLTISKKYHMGCIRRSIPAKQLVMQVIANMRTQTQSGFKLDNWLAAWRLGCIVVGQVDVLESMLTKEARKVNMKRKSSANKQFSPPYTFIYHKQSDQYSHLFSLWLKFCRLIRQDCKVTTALKIMHHFFIRNIANQKELHCTMSVMNTVHILTVCVASQLTIISQCSVQRQTMRFVVPDNFQHFVQAFDDLNCHSAVDKWLLRACGEEIQAKDVMALPKVQQEAVEMLCLTLDYLVGMRNQHFNVLKHSMSKFSLENGEAAHCVILTLTVYANLVLTSSCTERQLTEYRGRIRQALQPLSVVDCTASHLQRTFHMFLKSQDIRDLFKSVLFLLSTANQHANLLEIKTTVQRGKPTRSVFAAIQLDQVHRQPLPALLEQVTSLPVTVSSPITLPEATPHARSPHSVQSKPFSAVVSQQSQIQPEVIGRSGTLELPQQPSSYHLVSAGSLGTPLSEVGSKTEQQSVGKDSGPGSSLTTQQTEENALQYIRTMSTEGDKDNLFDDLDDADVLQALAAGAGFESHGSAVAERVAHDLALASSSKVVDQTYCTCCNKHLQPAIVNNTLTSLDSPVIEPEMGLQLVEQPHVEDQQEIFEAHCASDDHKLNEKLYGIFHDRLNKYEILKKELCMLIEECEQLPVISRCVTDGREELRKNEQQIKSFADSAEWRRGAHEIEHCMLDRLQSVSQRIVNEKEGVTERIGETLPADSAVGYHLEPDEDIEYEARLEDIDEVTAVKHQRRRRHPKGKRQQYFVKD